jgi:hypothetical protein
MKTKPTHKGLTQTHGLSNTTTDNMSTSRISTANEGASDYYSDEEFHENEMDTTQKDQVKEVQEMAKRETRNMRAWKGVVSITVLVTAILVSSAGTFIFLKNDEESSFEESYNSFANTIGDAAEGHEHNLFSAMHSFSNTISAAAIATNSELPFVTVPTFEVLAAAARQQSGAELIIFSPKVQVDEVIRWNEYATANEWWYEESQKLAISSSEGSLVQSDFAPGSPLPFLYETFQDENGNPSVMPAMNDPPFYPVWQISPPPFSPSLIKANIGVKSDFLSCSKAVDFAREGLLGATSFSDVYGLSGLASKHEVHEDFHNKFMDSSDMESVAFHDKFMVSMDMDTDSAYTRPHTFFTQPIFREIFNDTSEVVGYIIAIIPWDLYFANLLPNGAKGIACVASNTCGQSFTYFLDGNNVSCSRSKIEWCISPGCGYKTNPD